MRISSLVLGAVLLATPVLADVPGPKPVCNAPPECVGCSVAEPECKSAALDAGLLATDCRTQRGTPVNYYCPPGVEPYQGCGCSGGAGASLFAVGAMLWLGRRRRK